MYFQKKTENRPDKDNNGKKGKADNVNIIFPNSY